jgi:hypothetical protein
MKALTYLLSFLLFACSSNDDKPQEPQDQLPPVTTHGANTAGAIINGIVIIPKNSINPTSGFPVYGLRALTAPLFGQPNFNHYFSVKFTNLKKKGLNYSIYIHLNSLENGESNYVIGQSNGQSFLDGPNNPQIIISELADTTVTKIFLSSSNSGIIKILKFDYPNRIISGTFECNDLYNRDNPTEKISVKDGRFDINLITLNQ